MTYSTFEVGINIVPINIISCIIIRIKLLNVDVLLPRVLLVTLCFRSVLKIPASIYCWLGFDITGAQGYPSTPNKLSLET